MSDPMQAAAGDVFAAEAALEQRIAFVRRVYAHVGAATVLLVGLIAVILGTPAVADALAGFAFGQPWAVLIAFLVATSLAHRMAESHASPVMQYLGLATYALAQAVFIAPLLYLLSADGVGGDEVILQAAMLTLVIFGGLTFVVLVTQADFSFLRNVLVVGALAAMSLVLLSFLTSISLGTWFSAGMVTLMSAFILYETSNVLHHYQTREHVAASLAVFSSLTTLFWFVLRLMSVLGDD